MNLITLSKRPQDALQGSTSKDNNQSLLDFGIMVKRYRNKIKEGHSYSVSSLSHP